MIVKVKHVQNHSPVQRLLSRTPGPKTLGIRRRLDGFSEEIYSCIFTLVIVFNKPAKTIYLLYFFLLYMRNENYHLKLLKEGSYFKSSCPE